MGFQPFEVYPEVLGSADILISILEPDAGVFSVPSKVLSYLCAARPIVLSAPLENLACRILTVSGGGKPVLAGDAIGLAGAVRTLLDDRQLNKSAGDCGRQYAEQTFDIGTIGNRFEKILFAAHESLKGVGYVVQDCQPSAPLVDELLDGINTSVLGSPSQSSAAQN
jgi:glycosyltransferase involved in cell wall biosynthesis